MNINEAYKIYLKNLEVLEPNLGYELSFAIDRILDYAHNKAEKLEEEVFSLQLEVQASDKIAIEKMRETESYKELYELCAEHIGEVQHKLDLCELAEAKARMNEEKYTAVALQDTFNEFKMQRKINKLSDALKFYADKSCYDYYTIKGLPLIARDNGNIARQALEVVLDEKN